MSDAHENDDNILPPTPGEDGAEFEQEFESGINELDLPESAEEAKEELAAGDAEAQGSSEDEGQEEVLVLQSDNFYLLSEGEKHGPCTKEEVLKMLELCNILYTDWYSHDYKHKQVWLPINKNEEFMAHKKSKESLPSKPTEVIFYDQINGAQEEVVSLNNAGEKDEAIAGLMNMGTMSKLSREDIQEKLKEAEEEEENVKSLEISKTVEINLGNRDVSRIYYYPIKINTKKWTYLAVSIVAAVTLAFTFWPSGSSKKKLSVKKAREVKFQNKAKPKRVSNKPQRVNKPRRATSSSSRIQEAKERREAAKRRAAERRERDLRRAKPLQDDPYQREEHADNHYDDPIELEPSERFDSEPRERELAGEEDYNEEERYEEDFPEDEFVEERQEDEYIEEEDPNDPQPRDE